MDGNQSIFLKLTGITPSLFSQVYRQLGQKTISKKYFINSETEILRSVIAELQIQF
jgi:hypothetical protein